MSNVPGLMKGVIYTRVSSDEQVKGTSLEFQEDLCRKYCEQKGVEVAAVFREEGETAKDLSLNNRKKFLEALEFCRKYKNQIQNFVVLRVDRFARNTEDHFAVRKILLGYGTSLHSVTEPIGNKPAEKFIETVLAGAAEYDNAIRKQRCTDGMMSRINQGFLPWQPPPGYDCLNSKKRGEKKTEPDPPNERLFPIIQRGLKEFAQGMYSQVELAQAMNKWGFENARGIKCYPQFVDRILGKYLKHYAGIITNPWTGKDVDGLHKPMITKDEMYQIMLIRSGKARNVARNKYNSDFPLRRTVRCGVCMNLLTASSPRSKGNKYFYYHCKNSQCLMYGKSIPKLDLERDFLVYLERITPKEDFLAVFREIVLDSWKDDKQLWELEAKKCARQMEIVETKKKRIYEMREDGSYTKEEFIERKEAVENEIATVKISLSEARIEEFDVESSLTYAASFIRDVGRQWFDLPPQLRQKFQKLVFPEGIAYLQNEGFGNPNLSAIYELNRRFADKQSHLVAQVRASWKPIMQELKAWHDLQLEIAPYYPSCQN